MPKPHSGFDCWMDGVKGQLIAWNVEVGSGVAFCQRTGTSPDAPSRKTIELWPPCWWHWPQTMSSRHILIWVMEKDAAPPLLIHKLHAEGALADVCLCDLVFSVLSSHRHKNNTYHRLRSGHRWVQTIVLSNLINAVPYSLLEGQVFLMQSGHLETPWKDKPLIQTLESCHFAVSTWAKQHLLIIGLLNYTLLHFQHCQCIINQTPKLQWQLILLSRSCT